MGFLHVLSGGGFGIFYAGIVVPKRLSSDVVKVHVQEEFTVFAFSDVVVWDVTKTRIVELIVDPDEELAKTKVFADVLLDVALVVTRCKRSPG